MLIEEAITAYCLLNPGLAGLIDDRLEPGQLPGGVLPPAVTYHRIGGRRIASNDAPRGYQTFVATFQFTCYGCGYLQVLQLKDRLLAAFDGYQGTLDPQGEVYCQVATIENEQDTPTEETVTLWSSTVDVMLWYTRAI